MKKVFLFIFMFFLSSCAIYANGIDRLIEQTDFEKESNVSIYALDFDKNKVLYKRNINKLLNPASVLKVLTFGTSYFVLGENYNFETALYKYNNDIYIKLGGDTLLTHGDLNSLFKTLFIKYKKLKIDNIYIDSSIIDNIPYPSGWMEDDIWPNQRPITPYIIDNNYTKVAIKRSSLATKVDILQDDNYKVPIINQLKLGNTQNYKIKRMYGEDSNIVGFEGTISQDEFVMLPVLNPELNFNIKVLDILDDNKIPYDKEILSKKTPKGALKIASRSHSIKDISKNVLLFSDNFTAEVIFKIAAAKYINYTHSATLDDAVKMFYDINKEVITEGIKITDGSGVSRYNLVNAEFICNNMRYLFTKTDLKSLMATSSQGTMNERLLFLKDNIKAKTGTLSNMSSIAGALNSSKGKNILFCIIVQNSSKRPTILKNFENTVIYTIYKKY